MTGLTIRRFVLQNITAVAAHCPSTAVAAAAVAVMTGGGDGAHPSASASPPPSSMVARWVQRVLVGGHAGATTTHSSTHLELVTQAEMEWIRRRRREDAEESRVVLATRPSRSLLRGIGGGGLNVVLGVALAPLVALAVALERVRLGSGAAALLTGPCYGLLWGSIFCACAQYAAVQQVVLSVYYGVVAAPLRFCVNRRPRAGVEAAASASPPPRRRARAWLWNGLSCCFEVPRGVAGTRHPLLQLHDDAAVLRERAMRRVSRRDADKSKRNAKYSGAATGGAVADDDYYGLLGVPADATPRQIKEAYNQQVLHLHPDRNPRPDAALQFDRVTKAYRVLSNPQKRRKFDMGGTKGVEDTGAKKREAVRALFGGEEVHRLVGDVFLGSFSQRVIDGLDYTGEELAVVRQRLLEQCRDELLTQYLVHYESVDSAAAAGGLPNSSSSSSGSGGSRDPWKSGVLAARLRGLFSTGLAKEVLYTTGQEYRRVIAYYDMEVAVQGSDAATSTARPVSLPALAVARARSYLRETAPHRWHVQRQKLKYLVAVRRDSFKDSQAMVDLAWHTCVHELEATARTVALALLYDPQLPEVEVVRRRNALAALADTFIQYGQPYKGASKSTMDQLMNSMRDYQQQKQREKDAQ
ncbi:DnaJ domain/X-domain of DnaJ-containing [Novymonas esmeraldas]|uniref:DnaJ domain/X-domain of DnaJ-containing n=1 Tax=Novymonas esmeraldas TaxID=1808958 RepID=A0AAW0EKV2_9TRYP